MLHLIILFPASFIYVLSAFEKGQKLYNWIEVKKSQNCDFLTELVNLKFLLEKHLFSKSL